MERKLYGISNRLKEINTYGCIRQVGIKQLELKPLNYALIAKVDLCQV